MNILSKTKSISFDEFLEIIKTYESSVCSVLNTPKQIKMNEEREDALRTVYKSIEAKRNFVFNSDAHLTGRAMQAQFAEYEW